MAKQMFGTVAARSFKAPPKLADLVAEREMGNDIAGGHGQHLNPLAQQPASVFCQRVKCKHFGATFQASVD